MHPNYWSFMNGTGLMIEINSNHVTHTEMLHQLTERHVINLCHLTTLLTVSPSVKTCCHSNE